MLERLGPAASGLREAVVTGLDAVGGFGTIGVSAWRQQRLFTLCFHGFSLHDEHECDPLLFASPAFLKRRFELVRDSGWTVLSLGEGLERMQAGTLPPRSVAITIDDGFHDFAATDVSLLSEFGFAAANYVSTYCCLNQLPNPALTLRYILWRGRDGTFLGKDEPVVLVEPVARNRFAKALLSPAVVAAGCEAHHDLLGEHDGAVGDPLPILALWSRFDPEQTSVGAKGLKQCEEPRRTREFGRGRKRSS